MTRLLDDTLQTHFVRTEGRASIGLVASSHLGDALVLLTLGQNLVQNGFAVTLYSDYLSTLAPLVSSLALAPLPRAGAIYATLQHHHEVLYDGGSTTAQAFAQGLEPDGAATFICYTLTRRKHPPAIVLDHRARIAARYPPSDRARFLPFADCNCHWRDPKTRRASLVDTMVYVARDLLQLQTLTRATGLESQRLACRDPRKVLLHPTSAGPSKRWPARRFVALARKLRAHGWHPVFTVSPAEHDTWTAYVGSEFPVPLFPGIRSLCDFYRDGALFIGNDSGNAHLASALGVPTVVITHHYSRHYRWRPDWAPGVLVRPTFSRRVVRGAWPYFLPVNRVFRKALRLYARNGA